MGQIDIPIKNEIPQMQKCQGLRMSFSSGNYQTGCPLNAKAVMT